jgi:hypothetical protein
MVEAGSAVEQGQLAGGVASDHAHVHRFENCIEQALLLFQCPPHGSAFRDVMDHAAEEALVPDVEDVDGHFDHQILAMAIDHA